MVTLDQGQWPWVMCTPDFLTYTLPKKKGTFQSRWRRPVSWNYSYDLYSDVLRLCENGEEFWNGVFDKLLPEAMYKWNLAQSLLTYTPPQKKGTFRKVAFLLWKSVQLTLHTADVPNLTNVCSVLCNRKYIRLSGAMDHMWHFRVHTFIHKNQQNKQLFCMGSFIPEK